MNGLDTDFHFDVENDQCIENVLPKKWGGIAWVHCCFNGVDNNKTKKETLKIDFR